MRKNLNVPKCLSHPEWLSVKRAHERCRPSVLHGPREHQPISDVAEGRVIQGQVLGREPFRGKTEKRLLDDSGGWGQTTKKESEAGAFELAEATQNLRAVRGAASGT